MPAVLTRAAVEARRGERARRGTLTKQKVSARTHKLYTDAIHYFFWFVALVGLPEAIDHAALDRQLCEYIEHLYESGLGHNHAGFAISGAQFFLRTQRNTFVN